MQVQYDGLHSNWILQKFYFQQLRWLDWACDWMWTDQLEDPWPSHLYVLRCILRAEDEMYGNEAELSHGMQRKKWTCSCSSRLSDSARQWATLSNQWRCQPTAGTAALPCLLTTISQYQHLRKTQSWVSNSAQIVWGQGFNSITSNIRSPTLLPSASPNLVPCDALPHLYLLNLSTVLKPQIMGHDNS